jgi:thiol-disulfide isomerase/thioredoxin
MKILLCAFAFAVFLFSPVSATSKHSPLKRGEWRGALTLNDSIEVPFTFTLTTDSGGYTMVIHNAEENIFISNIRVAQNDSFGWRMPVFDSWFKCKRKNDTAFSGTWFNNSASKPYRLQFNARYAEYRIWNHSYFAAHFPPAKGEATFNPGTADEYKAIGLFTMRMHKNSFLVTGTFQTETGDYRYLEGQSRGLETVLSCFDGSHAFLFVMQNRNDTFYGDFYSGKFGHEKFIMVRNESFQLRDPEKLTYVTDSSKINFTFSDLYGKPVSLSDPQFRGKVVILQVMGSWCPNCMDETAWMNEMYKKYHAQGLEIIALAYERSPDTAKANPNIRRVKERFHAEYTFLNTGKSGRDSASASLPFLNGIMSFPTTIYLDRAGNVRKVYTGFNGPATGEAYRKDTTEAEEFIKLLLDEK